MKLTDKLRSESEQHPLDADLELFNAAASRIEALESALILITNSNSNWAMNIDDRSADAIQRFIDIAQSE